MHSKVVKDVVEWIEQCILNNKKINIVIVAHKSGYSLRHIQNIFRKEVSVTLGNYIRLRRITQAALLVKFTRKSIFDIAIDLNYGSQQAFCRTFYAHFHCSPLEYRKRNFLDTSELYPPYPSIQNALFFKEEKGVAIHLNAQQIRYEDTIIGKSDDEIQTLRYNKVMEILEHHQYAYIASDMFYLNTPEVNIGINSYIGFESEISSKESVFIKNNKNTTIFFEGTWPEYRKFSRKLYVNSAFSRVDGYDIERFSLSPAQTKNEVLFNVKMSIPI